MNWNELINRAPRTDVPQAPAELPTVPPRQEQMTPAWLADRGTNFAGFPSGEVVNLKPRIACLQADLTSVRADLARVQAELDELRGTNTRPMTLADAALAHQQEMEEIRRRKRYDDSDLWVIPE